MALTIGENVHDPPHKQRTSCPSSAVGRKILLGRMTQILDLFWFCWTFLYSAHCALPRALGGLGVSPPKIFENVHAIWWHLVHF